MKHYIIEESKIWDMLLSVLEPLDYDLYKNFVREHSDLDDEEIKHWKNRLSTIAKHFMKCEVRSMEEKMEDDYLTWCDTP